MRISVNEAITAPEVRVMAPHANASLGVMAIADALRLAREQRLDLVLVNPSASPPVCKLMKWPY